MVAALIKAIKALTSIFYLVRQIKGANIKPLLADRKSQQQQRRRRWQTKTATSERFKLGSLISETNGPRQVMVNLQLNHLRRVQQKRKRKRQPIQFKHTSSWRRFNNSFIVNFRLLSCSSTLWTAFSADGTRLKRKVVLFERSRIGSEITARKLAWKTRNQGQSVIEVQIKHTTTRELRAILAKLSFSLPSSYSSPDRATTL